MQLSHGHELSLLRELRERIKDYSVLKCTFPIETSNISRIGKPGKRYVFPGWRIAHPSTSTFSGVAFQDSEKNSFIVT